MITGFVGGKRVKLVASKIWSFILPRWLLKAIKIQCNNKKDIYTKTSCTTKLIPHHNDVAELLAFKKTVYAKSLSELVIIYIRSQQRTLHKRTIITSFLNETERCNMFEVRCTSQCIERSSPHQTRLLSGFNFVTGAAARHQHQSDKYINTFVCTLYT